MEVPAFYTFLQLHVFGSNRQQDLRSKYNYNVISFKLNLPSYFKFSFSSTCISLKKEPMGMRGGGGGMGA
jgi:hypothetical protein